MNIPSLVLPTLSTKTILIAVVVFFGLGSLTGFYFTQKYYAPKLEAANAEVTALNAKYSTVEQEKEDAIIAQAIAEKKANTPVKEVVQGTNTTSIQYVAKTSASDPDLAVTNEPATVSFSYNGQITKAKTTTTESGKTVDGKWVVTQQNSTTLNVDDIVNRQIANTILERDAKERVLERQKKQNLFWGIVGGATVGYLVNK